MNNDLSIMLAPLGCFSQSKGFSSFQRTTQSYSRDPKAVDQMSERKRLVRVILSLRRFTPEADCAIRSYLRTFDYSKEWEALTEMRRIAMSKELFERVHKAAVGRLNGMTSFYLSSVSDATEMEEV